MSNTTTEDRVSVAERDRVAADSASARADPATYVRGVAAYYRLRSIALEARVSTLEEELKQKDRQLQETIARYEQILQDRPEEGVVSGGSQCCCRHTPDD